MTTARIILSPYDEAPTRQSEALLESAFKTAEQFMPARAIAMAATRFGREWSHFLAARHDNLAYSLFRADEPRRDVIPGQTQVEDWENELSHGVMDLLRFDDGFSWRLRDRPMAIVLRRHSAILLGFWPDNRNTYIHSPFASGHDLVMERELIEQSFPGIFAFG